MKYYSTYCEELVRKIINDLNSLDVQYLGKPLSTSSFPSVTAFIQNYLIQNESIYSYLLQKNLINTKCPYTGEAVYSSSPSWGVYGRYIYLSDRGMQLMKREVEDQMLKETGIVYDTDKQISRKRKVNGSAKLLTYLLYAVVAWLLYKGCS